MSSDFNYTAIYQLNQFKGRGFINVLYIVLTQLCLWMKLGFKRFTFSPLSIDGLSLKVAG